MKTKDYLTTKEFIKRVKELGYNVGNSRDYYHIVDKINQNIANINKSILCQISTDYIAWDDIPDKDKKTLFKLLMEYASTPVEERKEEKKYYLKHGWLRSRFEDKIVNQDGEDEYFLSDESQTDGFKTQFTQKEIDEIKEKYNTDLSDFEEKEVEE